MTKVEELKKDWVIARDVFVSLHSNTRHSYNEKLKADAAAKLCADTHELAAEAASAAEVVTANAYAEWKTELKRVQG